MFVIRPPPQKQYLEHMGSILSLNHLSIYQFFNLFPFSVLHSNMFNVGRTLTRGIVVANIPPFGPTKQYVHCMPKVTTWCHFENSPPRTFKTIRLIRHMKNVWNLRPLDPTQQYTQHMDQIDMLIHSFGFTCPVPYETACLVYEPAWHHCLCQNIPCLPLQPDNTLNPWKERHLESFLKFAVLRPYKVMVKKTVKVDTSSFFYGES